MSLFINQPSCRIPPPQFWSFWVFSSWLFSPSPLIHFFDTIQIPPHHRPISVIYLPSNGTTRTPLSMKKTFQSNSTTFLIERNRPIHLPHIFHHLCHQYFMIFAIYEQPPSSIPSRPHQQPHTRTQKPWVDRTLRVSDVAQSSKETLRDSWSRRHQL